MKGIEWSFLYNAFKNENYDSVKLEEISRLMQDEDVTNKKGICTKCNKHFELNEMKADHITPWHEGGKTIADNRQLLCKEDNRRKSGK